MSENKDNKDKKPILHTGNDGKVFWSKDPSTSLGTIMCGICVIEKPFETCRWDEQLKRYTCNDCRNK